MANEVTTEIQNRIMVITLNRPDAMNAVNQELAEQLAAALESLDSNADLSVGVLTGAGRGFCAGMDLKEFVSKGMPMVGDRGFGGITERCAKKPVICAVEGFALAGGLELALSTDLIVASKGAKFGIPEVGVGLFAGAGAQAYEMGLVAELAEKGEALSTAIELAERVAKNAPLGLIASKELIREMQGRTEAEFWEYQKAQVDTPATF